MTGRSILNETLEQTAAQGGIVAKDVARLRAEIFSDGLVSRAEAERLLSLDGKAVSTCMEWTVFLVEAVSDYLVHQEVPPGYVSDANAAWLITAAGTASPANELEVLIGVLERARTSPARLSAHALERVADVVVDGVLRMPDGRHLVPGVIGKAEVDLLRRILYAFGGGAGIGISREEAEVLFDLNDRTAGAPNHPEWTELFVKAMANFVMCASGYTPPSREEALRHETFLDDTSIDVAGFFRSMASAGARGILDAYRASSGLEEAWRLRNGERAAADAKAEAIDAAEAEWLVNRITRDGTVHDNEKALLAFIGRESRMIHPSIRALIDKVA
ncbi:hypothetical protein EJC49_21585 [Aquibium carbonis]|uniref:Uncharacterized protein n=1 Tax=Aquibium carbonis TaxID=2495581 RepID=A0A3R9ZNH7_9HYPH|nr:hypothetical protein [Aquibium carbonis]RST83923.1 hypothetical protein EJC49_21585 [Aquibium carbonis]